MDTLAERLRRRPANPIGSPRVSSNPTGIALSKTDFCVHYTQQALAHHSQVYPRSGTTLTTTATTHHQHPPPPSKRDARVPWHPHSPKDTLFTLEQERRQCLFGHFSRETPGYPENWFACLSLRAPEPHVFCKSASQETVTMHLRGVQLNIKLTD